MKSSPRLLLLIAIIHLCVVPSCADWFGIGKSIDKIDNEMLPKVQEAFTGIKDEVVEALDSTIDKVNALYLDDMNQTERTIEKLVNQTKDAIDESIDNAFQQGQKFVDRTIDEIQHKIIESITAGVKDIETTFFQGVKNILGEIE